jgi:poly-gamma-glutamate synthesis protein (capsule biosynthesis protein)
MLTSIKQTLLVFSVMFSAASAQSADTVTMIFAGDLTLSDHVERFVGTRTGYVFGLWKPGREADIFMANLEHPVTTAVERVEKKFNFKMNPAMGATLLDAGLSLVNCANNHVFDYGFQGMDDTMRYLDSLEIPYVGLGRNIAEARRPVILERKGRKIGFLGYYGGGDFAATPSRQGFAPRVTRFIVEDVRKLRERVDYVVVNLHWGTERAPLPDDWQVTAAHRIVDAGADLIIGHHPHVLQGVERYKGKTIAYSLGNFVFGGNTAHTYETAVLKVALSDAGADIELLPVSVRKWQPFPSDDKTREAVLDLVRERSSHFPDHLFVMGVSQYE